jgi:hypothetical protein
MKRYLLLATLLAAIASPVLAQQTWDLALTFTPKIEEEEAVSLEDFLYGAHVGYGFLYIFYGSWDAIVVPPHIVQNMTTQFVENADGTQFVQDGYYRPGFIHLFDAGLRLIIGPFVASGQIGMNQLYLYKQEELPDIDASLGANIGLSAGLKFNFWGVSAKGNAIFPTFDQAVMTLAALPEGGAVAERALQTIVDNLIPSIVFTLYL